MRHVVTMQIATKKNNLVAALWITPLAVVRTMGLQTESLIRSVGWRLIRPKQSSQLNTKVKHITSVTWPVKTVSSVILRSILVS